MNQIILLCPIFILLGYYLIRRRLSSDILKPIVKYNRKLNRYKFEEYIENYERKSIECVLFETLKNDMSTQVIFKKSFIILECFLNNPNFKHESIIEQPFIVPLCLREFKMTIQPLVQRHFRDDHDTFVNKIFKRNYDVFLNVLEINSMIENTFKDYLRYYFKCGNDVDDGLDEIMKFSNFIYDDLTLGLIIKENLGKVKDYTGKFETFLRLVEGFVRKYLVFEDENLFKFNLFYARFLVLNSKMIKIHLNSVILNLKGKKFDFLAKNERNFYNEKHLWMFNDIEVFVRDSIFLRNKFNFCKTNSNMSQIYLYSNCKIDEDFLLFKFLVLITVNLLNKCEFKFTERKSSDAQLDFKLLNNVKFNYEVVTKK